MIDHTQKQLALFIKGPSVVVIEQIRAKYNPLQHDLIAAHITLCREDEIGSINEITKRLESLKLTKRLRIICKNLERFADGKGVFISCAENEEFENLRELVLGSKQLTKKQLPHITLMHPRNSISNDEIFEKLQNEKLPTELFFDTISLIEQKDGGKWKILKEFQMLDN